MDRHELTDEQFGVLVAHPAQQKPRTGRPAKDHWLVLENTLWVLRTGAPWRDLPEKYGSWRAVYSRFRRWQRAGVWERVFAALQRQADVNDRLDWTLLFADSTVVGAHQHAAGAKKEIGSRSARPQ